MIKAPGGDDVRGPGGGERVRFCARCRLNVFNIKELTEVEVRALFLKADGRVCGRVYRRPDGTVLTKDCPTGLAALRRKALVAVTMSVALVLAVVGFRAKSLPGGPSAGGAGWFQRTLQARLIDARETLRHTRTLGPLIDELYPREVVAGEMEPFPP